LTRKTPQGAWPRLIRRQESKIALFAQRQVSWDRALEAGSPTARQPESNRRGDSHALVDG